MSDERRDDHEAQPPGAEPEAPDDGDGVPEPATWAGRRGQAEPDDAVETGDGEPDAVEARADEGPDPGDEFDYAGDEEPDDAGDEEPDDADLEEAPEDEGEEMLEDESEEAPAEGVQETLEADTLALADSEEAREAALAGLRARTAKHAAKRGITDPGPATPPPPPPAPAAETPPPAPAQEEPRPEPVASAAEEAPHDQQAPKAGLWARFVAASFLVIVSMATATAVSILVYLTDIAKGLGGLQGLSSQLAQLDEKAQNFLILGSDVRPEEGKSRGRSDTTILLRVDPDKGVISQLSIPRDLEVNIPGHGVDKFNAAYSYGGPKLTLEVVKQLTGDRVPIHHVVNVDFTGFADAVNAIGCVYIDVDRHYFNDNTTVAFEEQYAVINIEAGYQRLCGLKALQYVRYRHEDNDLVRSARQQSFLREARQNVPPSKLLNERNELIDIFTDYTTSDIDDTGTLVGLFKLMLQARNAQINQVPFRTTSLGDESGYVTYSNEGLTESIDEFLGVGVEIGAPGQEDGGGDGGGKAGGSKDEEAEKDKPAEPPPPPPMLDSTVSGQQYAAAIQGQADGELKFPVLYPTSITPSATITDDSRFFRIDGPADRIYRGYKFVMSFPSPGGFTGYYGVSGTDWGGAPLFENPSERRTIGEREYSLYYDAGKLRMVSFERDGASYWVTNSLDKILTEPQMLTIARNLAEAGS